MTAATTQASDGSEGHLEHKFNDDIALADADVEFLARQFPDILHVLNNPDLRSEFTKHDRTANLSKRRVHVAGLTAIGAAAIALLAAAIKPALHLVHLPERVSPYVGPALASMELLAIVAAVISLGGFAIGAHKHKWLESRMLTEILRAWHFQFLIYQGQEIERSCVSESARVGFEAKRKLALESFVREWSGKADSYLTNLVDDAAIQYVPLHDSISEYSDSSPIQAKIFRAYRMLRFQHQLTYATHKLKSSTERQFWEILKWPTRVLQDRSNSFARFCVLGSLFLSVVVPFAYYFGHETAAGLASIAIIALLILNVVARTIQDGLASPKELERYRDYQQKARFLLQRFDRATTVAERVHLMRDMERAAIEELRSFLRANEEAAFVL